MSSTTTAANPRAGLSGCKRAQKSTSPIDNMRVEDERIIATVALGYDLMDATLDTGSCRSFISSYFAHKLENADKIKKINKRLHMVNGVIQTVKEEIMVQVRMGLKSCVITLLIFPEVVDDLVLGLDFLARMGTKFECGDLYVEINATPNGVEIENYNTNKKRRMEQEMAADNEMPGRTEAMTPSASVVPVKQTKGHAETMSRLAKTVQITSNTTEHSNLVSTPSSSGPSDKTVNSPVVPSYNRIPIDKQATVEIPDVPLTNNNEGSNDSKAAVKIKLVPLTNLLSPAAHLTTGRQPELYKTYSKFLPGDVEKLRKEIASIAPLRIDHQPDTTQPFSNQPISNEAGQFPKEAASPSPTLFEYHPDGIRPSNVPFPEDVELLKEILEESITRTRGKRCTFRRLINGRWYRFRSSRAGKLSFNLIEGNVNIVSSSDSPVISENKISTFLNI